MPDRSMDAGVLASARRECLRRLDAGEPLEAVEQYIAAVPIDPDARSSLWLWAWSWRRLPSAPRNRPRRGRQTNKQRLA